MSEMATREDVVSLLWTIDTLPELEECIINGLNAAGAMFMLCIHVLVPMTLMANVEDYAEKVHQTSANQAFKEDLSL